MKVKSESEVAESCLTLSDPVDCTYQAPPSTGFSRQEYWSGVPLPSPSRKTRASESNSGGCRERHVLGRGELDLHSI